MTDSYTPLMNQYNAIKAQYPEAILLFRIGDFYEMFGDDAVKGARILKLTLTRKHVGKDRTVPLAGVPHHAVQSYMAKLIQAGCKVAICDQLEDPKFAKGIVKRDVTRVITPGTVLETTLLDEKTNSFLMAINLLNPSKQAAIKLGIALIDLSTGEFLLTEFIDTKQFRRLDTELQRLQPREILIPNDIGLEGKPLQEILPIADTVAVNPYHGMNFDPDIAYRGLLEQMGTTSLQGFGCEEMKTAIGAAGAVLAYLRETQKNSLDHIKSLRTYTLEDYMVLDPATLQNLEIFRSNRDGSQEGSLFAVMDQTLTGMGGRKLKSWLSQPLMNLHELNRRHDAIECFLKKYRFRESLRLLLDRVYDLERLLARIGCQVGNARDMLALGKTLELLPEIKKLVQENDQPLEAENGDTNENWAGTLAPLPESLLSELQNKIHDLSELQALIKKALVEDPPLTLKEGGLIRDGYNPELDELRKISRSGKQWIMELESRERERTGIKSLKIRFNNVFGYYIEITNANLSMVPEDYQRKQTLTNAERFITPELKDWETRILGAEERMMDLEYQLFCELREKVSAHTTPIQESADAIGQLDALSSLAETAAQNDYCRPEMAAEPVLEIKDGRHPVIEHVLPPGKFVPNDLNVDTGDNRLLLITGPNMAGKSTFIRQAALIVLMAQAGSFVPAHKARIGLADRIFTRVGASDNLLRGESTFMVEMNETANILNNATNRSLLVLDEIGRGTSTFDGLSIAWAVAEYIHDKIGARTLFATHYHELTQLTQSLRGIKNFNVAVREWNDQVVFLHKIIEGACDKSYGIAVGRLAGLPEPVIIRAREVLTDLEKYSETTQTELAKTHAPVNNIRPQVSTVQLTFFETALDPILEEIKGMDLTVMNPMQALLKLQEYQDKLKKK
jgi:DNA mismatch repair protein MutS